jgi:glycerol-3-phosphate dehydrogenase
LSAEQRANDLAEMARDGVDVLVIGGGITGAGIALDASLRGYRVGLVERGDFASGTSGQSTKLVHGGIRYLPQGDVSLVREALVERGRLLANAPHLVHPREFVLPLYSSSRRPVGLPIAPPWGIGLGEILNLGLSLYDTLAGHANIASHRRISREDVLRRAPGLLPNGITRGFLYTDGQTDDTRLTLAVMRSAADVGALVANYAEVVGFDQRAGRLAAAQVRLRARGDDGCEIVIPARHIVNATGVFAERVEALTGASPLLDIQPSKGVHLVVRHESLAMTSDAVVLPETSDGRILFLVPWRSRIIIGTTDTGSGDLDRPRADATDVDYLLAHVNRSVSRPLSRAEIVSTYAGYRPLLRLRHARTPSRLSRSHVIVDAPSGLISISGGKLTTYRAMAQEVVDRIDDREGQHRPCLTATWPLAGAVGWPAALPALAERGARLGLPFSTIVHLGASYGTLASDVLDRIESDPSLAAPLDPELPATLAEADYAIAAEQALTLADILDRRLRLSIEAADYGQGAAPLVAAHLARALGWDDATRVATVAAYAAIAETHRAGLVEPIAASA